MVLPGTGHIKSLLDALIIFTCLLFLFYAGLHAHKFSHISPSCHNYFSQSFFIVILLCSIPCLTSFTWKYWGYPNSLALPVSIVMVYVHDLQHTFPLYVY